jgi:DmsE family decaheme c-type cytochrome
MRRPHRRFLGSLLVVLSALAVSAAAQDNKKEEQPEGAACRGCHEDRLAKFDRTPHAGATESCLSCHKGADAHMKGRMEGQDTPAPRLGELKAADANAVCQTCHEAKHNQTWLGSSHARRGVRCTDCHSVHDAKSPQHQLKTASDPETCYSCHASVRAQGLRTSHHPVREGLMTCATCHDPHDGTKPKMVKAEYTNELCYQCHTEKRGPFLWEHAPVRENCLSCHNAHGSNHDKLLVSQQPWLCQRCHLNTRHPGTLYSGINTGTSVELSSNRATEHACKNCHQNVHGGNAPSGPYLGR